MSRSRVLLALGIAVLVGLVVAWLIPTNRTAPSGTRARSTARARDMPQQPRHTEEWPVDSDPDPDGVLRLEGQVLEEGEHPVGGVTVWLWSGPPRTVITEADGSFVFEGLLPRAYRLSARRDADYALAGVRMRDDTEPIILRLHRGNTLAITVLDDDTGTPIADALVSDHTTQEVRSGRDGTAVLRGLAPRFNFFSIEADGYSPADLSVRLSNDPDGRHERLVRLGRGAAISGRVLGPDGVPVEGAVVSGFPVEVVTGADGKWQIVSIGRGRYVVVADARGLLASEPFAVDVDGVTARDDVTLRLREGGELGGTVVDATGAPVARAIVRVGDEATTSSDATGHFAMRGLAAVPTAVFATSGDGASPFASVVPGSVDAHNLRLAITPSTIEGIVVDGTGAPVAEAAVVAISASLSEASVADGGGRFVVGPLPPGDYTLAASRPSWDPVVRARRKRKGEHSVSAATGARDVQVPLPSTGSVIGLVQQGGSPVEVFGVAITDRPARFEVDSIPQVIRSSDGQFELRDVAPGTWMIGIVGEGFARTEVRGVEVRADEVTDIGTIEVEPGRTVSGRVIDVTGAGIAAAKVIVAPVTSVQRLGDDPMRARLLGYYATTTDATGRFTIVNVAESRHRPHALASHPHHGQSRELEVPDGGEVTLELVATGSIEGMVTDRTVDLTDSMMAIREIGSKGQPTMIWNDGTNEFFSGDLPTGRYQVWLDTPNGRRSAIQEVDVPAGSSVHVEFIYLVETITLAVVRGSRTCEHVMVADAVVPSQSTSSLRPCMDATIDFPGLVSGEYRLCVDQTCKQITVAVQSGNQRVDVTGW